MVARSRRLLGVRETVRFARQLSKVRTVCGSSARTDLCGGRSERPSHRDTKMGVLELGKQLGIAEASEQAVVELALAEPGWGQVRAANELKKQGVFISPAGVRCVWLRHDLENIKKRLKALETKSQQDGLILSESQVAALEKAKRRRKPTGNSKVNVQVTCFFTNETETG